MPKILHEVRRDADHRRGPGDDEALAGPRHRWAARMSLVLTIPLILALGTGGPSPPSRGDGAPHASNAWLRAWLGPLEAESRRLVVGLENESPATIEAAIDARIDDPEGRAAFRDLWRRIARHAEEIIQHWSTYREEFARESDVVTRRFPGVHDDVRAAMALMRDCEWALLGGEKECSIMSNGIAQLAGTNADLLAALDDTSLPSLLRDALRDGLKMSVATIAIVALAMRKDDVDEDLARALAGLWRRTARSYTRVLVSSLSLHLPGFAARWSLEPHVDVDVVCALVRARPELEDLVLGAFAADADAVDEISRLAMQEREREEPRLSDG